MPGTLQVGSTYAQVGSTYAQVGNAYAQRYTHTDNCKTHAARSPIGRQIAVVLCTWTAIIGVGCRGRAKEDLYRQKLTSEIRVLEDQLYEADYENRILADKLARAEQRLRQADDVASPRYNEDLGDDRTDDTRREPERERPDRVPRRESGRDDDFDLNLDDIEIDPGIGTDPGTESDLGTGTDPGGRMPAPGGPEPPGADDLRIPPIEPGEIVPPPGPGSEPEGPPGQIELNDAMRFLGRTDPAESATPPPTEIRVHPTLSGPYRFDDEDEADGIVLVLNAIGEEGRVADLSGFEIDAEMTVVALDPTRDPADARVGRWEFDAERVRSLVRHDPVSGIRLPLQWKNDRPDGDEVIVHVRLRIPVATGDEAADQDNSMNGDSGSPVPEMVCEGRLNLAATASTARWTPRGDTSRRE